MSFDKNLLFQLRLPEASVELPGIPTSFRVRGLSRVEAMTVQGMKGAMAIERKVLALALLEPVLTEDEIGQWQQASTVGEMQPLLEKVLELSGMLEDSAKQAYKDFEADPGSEFRVLPGAEAVDDSGPAAGGAD